jgi:hypothetical protein
MSICALFTDSPSYICVYIHICSSLNTFRKLGWAVYVSEVAPTTTAAVAAAAATTTTTTTTTTSSSSSGGGSGSGSSEWVH